MEFRHEERIWGTRDVYADPMVGSDDEETLSFCDMPVNDIAGMSAELASAYRVSIPDSSDHEDFHFDLDFCTPPFVSCRTSSADDLFHNGRLLPLTQSNARFSYSDSTSFLENGLLFNEKLQVWRSNSATSNTSQPSHRSLNYSASQKVVRRVNSTAASNKSKGTANSTSFPSPKPSGSCSKTSPTWLRLLSLGIIKTPVMKLEDMRLRQCKRSGANLQRSVSSNYKEEKTVVKKAATFQQKSKSVKYNKQAEEMPRSKGLRVFRLFPSLNSCKSSINSVISCTNDKKFVELEALLDSGKPDTK